MSDKATLLEFGFPEVRIEKALKATNNSGLQPALDWLETHAEDPDIDSPDSAPKEEPEETSEEVPPEQAQSLVCNECGKQFKSEDLAQYHATKSGHTDFSESTDTVKPLTEEEKKEKLDALHQRIAEKRKQRDQAEQREQRQNELLRRKAGQDMGEQQEKLKEKMALQAIDRQKREKQEDKMAARKIKEQIEQDKRDRRARFEKEKAERQGEEPKATEAPKELPKIQAKGTEARLQIRPMVGGTNKPLTKVFGAEQTLKEVIGFIKSELPEVGSHFKLSMTFPRKDFGSKDESKTLKELGLVPNAALILS